MKNPSAFPHDKESGIWCQGMTLLDYFAGQALMGRTGRTYWMRPEEMAKQCYDFAEGMIKEREKRGVE